MDEARLLALLAGESRGFGPAITRGALAVLTIPYGCATGLRSLAYQRRWLPVRDVPAPVLSVGNLTTGGTGKTPVTAALANWLQSQGHLPAIVSRGYRALAGSENDEQRVLQQLTPGTVLVANRNRWAGSTDAILSHHATAILLDDGFQHQQLARDFDLVLIDAVRPWGFGQLLPRGLLREYRSSLRRADAILLTRTNLVDAHTRTTLTAEIARLAPQATIGEVVFEAAGWLPLAQERTGDPQRQRVIAFCGIGNPAAFERSLHTMGIHVAEMVRFADHHHYVPGDVERLASMARAQGAVLVTTLKDLVKLQPEQFADVPVLALRQTVHWIGCDSLFEQLAQIFAPRPTLQRSAA